LYREEEMLVTTFQHRCTYFCASAKALGLLIKKPDLGIFESCENTSYYFGRIITHSNTSSLEFSFVFITGKSQNVAPSNSSLYKPSPPPPHYFFCEQIRLISF